tara:strand:- start:293 stop:1165 length:873 start_codon:yes stop_codon:yes gene_type:complete
MYNLGMVIPDNEYRNFFEACKNHVGLNDVRTVSNRIFELYERRNGQVTEDNIRDHFSQIITDCIGLEKESWDNMRNEIYRDWIQIFLQIEDRATLFPTINQMIEETTIMLNNESTPATINQINSNLADFNSRLRISLHQSGFNRSGKSFEYHIERCFRILGMRFQIQKTIDNQTLDFVFPNVQRIENIENRGCAVMECQTTLKDRFRLSTARGQHLNLADKYAITGTGAGVVRDNDIDDFTERKLDEYVGANMIGVVLRPVAITINRQNIISFEDFVNVEYPRFSQMWNE